MMLSSGGKFYGMTMSGGVNNMGVLFEFNPATGLYVKKFDFNSEKGKNPYYTRLVEICDAPSFSSPLNDVSVCLNENTFFKVLTTGNWLTFQWQVDMGGGFVDVSDNSTYSGAQTDSLHINAASAGMNLYTYRCIVSSSCPDSVIYSNEADLYVRPHYEINQNAQVCDNEFYFWRGHSLNLAGTYYDSLNTQYGCDSVFVLHLQVNPTYEFSETAEICDNETFYWRGNTYNYAGTYYDSLLTISGCDSVYILHLITHPTFEFVHTAQICDDESYTWRGQTYVAAGTYHDSLTTQFGCDSVFTLNLIVHPTYEFHEIGETCDNASYIWRGNSYCAAGTYYDNLFTQFGCDSVFVLHLQVNPTYEFNQSAEICDNETFYWRGNTYNYAGTYYDSLLTSSSGCDSVYILHLITHPTFEFVHTMQICDNESYTWRGQTYVAAGTYHDSLTTQFGCDSVFTLNLIVHPTYEIHVNGQTCDNADFIWRGNSYSAAGTYYDSLHTQFGCDSVYVLHLLINPTFQFNESAEICDNETFYWRGRTLDTAGIYSDTLFTASGCDSVFVLTLITHPTYDSVFNVDICDYESYNWRGNTYYNSGTYYDSLTTIHGCDSIFVLNLYVHPHYQIPLSVNICQNESYFWRGHTFNSSGIYYDSLTTAYGCDSVYILALLVRPLYENVLNKQICANDVFIWRGNTYHQPGVYYDSLTSMFGCDSVFVLNLSVNPVYEFTQNAETCNNEGFFWRGHRYFNSGTYSQVLTSSSGCDSVFIMHLISHPAYETTEHAEICENGNYVWRGNTYTTQGLYTDSLHSMFGCDSVFKLNLIVHTVFHDTLVADICAGQSYFWRGNYYMVAGFYNENHTSVFGCDSNYTLKLNIHQPDFITENVSACSNTGYFWNDSLYFTSGIYYDSLTSVYGCDSINILNLTVFPAYEITEDAQICNGDVYSWHGNQYYTSGAYFDSLVTQHGCDSVSILQLTVHDLPVVTIGNLNPFYCVYHSSVVMSGVPAGGVFTGNGVTGSTFDPAQSGTGNWTIVYSYTDSSGCVNSDSQIVEVSGCDGIEKIDESSIAVYPNPTSGQLSIKFPAEDDYTLSFIDALGQIVQTEKIAAQKTAQLNLNSVAPGVYMLKIENAEGFVLKRVVVER